MNLTRIKVIFNKILKALKVFVICSLILTVMEIGLGFWLLRTRWELFISKTQMKEFATEITNSEPLPDNFKRIYKALYPKHLNTSMTEMIFFNYITRLILRDREFDLRPHCYCDLVYDLQVKENKELENIEWAGRVVDLEYGFGLEKYTTPEKCWTYFVNQHLDILRTKLNPKLFPNIGRDKIATMTDDEVIELILLLKSPGKYNRFKNPEVFEKQVAEYKLKLANAGVSLH